MKKITAFRQLLTITIAVIYFQTTIIVKQALPAGNTVKTLIESNSKIATILAILLSIVLGLISTGQIVKWTLNIHWLKSIVLLRGCLIEGLWYVEWWDDKNAFLGSELTEFSYDSDAHCIREKTIRFQTGIEKPIISKSVSTDFNDDLRYSSLYKYEDEKDFSEKYGVAIGCFEMRSSCNPDYFKFIDSGIHDKYHELHIGERIPRKRIKNAKKLDKSNWERKLFSEYMALSGGQST